jgi:transposase
MSEEASLFPAAGGQPDVEVRAVQPNMGRPRVRTADRSQRRMVVQCVDELIPYDHRARVFWTVVERLELSKFYETLLAREGHVGRSATDPKILLVLWLYAMSDGVDNARELDRLCQVHDAYRWICGGVHVNYHTLSSFRVDHGEALSDLLTQILAIMAGEGLIDLDCIAQDGLRVRANAGASSFHRKESLERRLEKAKLCVTEINAAAAEAKKSNRRQQAAAERGAREITERLNKALLEIPEIAKLRAKSHKKKDTLPEPRVSSTDPEARVMKMGDGGFRPAYNFQLATETTGRAIVGVSVTNVASDSGLMTPMLDQIKERTGETPKSLLVDAGYVSDEAVEKTAQREVILLAPVPDREKKSVPLQGKRQPTIDASSASEHAAEQTPTSPAAVAASAPPIPQTDRYTPRADDTPALAEWRQRMGTDEAKERYKDRAATAETTNAEARARGLGRLLVRGTKKALSIGLIFGLAYDIMRYAALTS